VHVDSEPHDSHRPGDTGSVAWRSVAVALATVAVTLLGFTAHQLVDRIVELEQQLHALQVAVAENTVHRMQHDNDARYWKDVIDSNRLRIGELATDSRARPDPFTGADGRKLRELIDANERRLDTVERCCNIGEHRK